MLNLKKKKKEKHLEISLFYTCVPKIYKIRSTVLEIKSVTKGLEQGTVPEIQSEKQNFLSSWAIFCPFTHLTTRKIKILKKLKKHLEM